MKRRVTTQSNTLLHKGGIFWGKDSQSTFQFSNLTMVEVNFVIHKDFNTENMGDELEIPIQVMFPPPSTIETQSNSVAAQLIVEVGKKDDSTLPFFKCDNGNRFQMGRDFARRNG